MTILQKVLLFYRALTNVNKFYIGREPACQRVSGTRLLRHGVH